MSVALLFFVLIGGVVAIIDYKKEVIPDKIMLPSIVILALISHFEGSLELNHLLAALLVGLFFVILLYFFADFGGGDIRFGVFCALFLGFPDIFVFFIIAGLIHTGVLAASLKKTVGFAPAMFVSSLATKLFASCIWGFL